MHKLVFSGLLATSALSAAALFAGGLPVRVVTAPSAAPVLNVKAPPAMAHIAPLGGSALATAVAQVRAAYPRGATAPATGPLTLDPTHWTATAGSLSGNLMIQGPAAIGADPTAPTLPAAWYMASDSSALLNVSGMQTGSLYLLDCAAQASDGTAFTLNMCMGNGGFMSCFTTPGSLLSANLSVSGNHALYGFVATQSSASLAVGNANNVAMSGCTLHPVN
jgi:hypothetical protein